MTTNREWLYSLDVADLADWFDAEHVENQERALDGDAAPESEDSRELLDADVRKWCGKYAYQADMVWTWLNRQAAITERKCRKPNWDYCETCETLAELTAERDNLADELLIANKQREEYREKFGKCLDYADAIHALMDEGIA